MDQAKNVSSQQKANSDIKFTLKQNKTGLLKLGKHKAEKERGSLLFHRMNATILPIPPIISRG